VGRESFRRGGGGRLGGGVFGVSGGEGEGGGGTGKEGGAAGVGLRRQGGGEWGSRVTV